MVKIIRQGVYFTEGRLVKEHQAFMTSDKKESALENTIVHHILRAHNRGDDFELKLKFDLLAASGDYFPDLLRTADASRIGAFHTPVVLFDNGYGRAFGLSAAKKFGAEFVSEAAADYSVYLCDRRAKSGEMILGCDNLSCGAIGALTFDRNEGDLLRQLLGGTYDIPRPGTVALYLKGKLRRGVGATDVALAILQAAGDCAENKILEAFGPGLSNLSMEQRLAIDTLLYATDCLSAVWATDASTEEFFESRGRADGFRALAPIEPAYYDGGIVVDLSRIEPMCRFGGKIRTVREVLETKDVGAEFLKEGRVFLPYAVFTRYSSGYGKIAEIAEIMRGKKIGGETEAFLFMPSAPIFHALAENGYLAPLIEAGITLESWESPAVNVYDGYDPDPSVVLLDAYTLAVSCVNGGYLTSALDYDYQRRVKKFKFDGAVYESRSADYLGKPQKEAPLSYDETIRPVPVFPRLPDDLELLVNGEEGTLAVTLGDPEDCAWGQAIDDRERGVFAALAASYSPSARTHLIDWGILPLTFEKFEFKEGDVLYLGNIRELIRSGEERIVAKVVGKRRSRDIALQLGKFTEEERTILLAGGRTNLLAGK